MAKAPNAGGLGLITGQRTRSPNAITKSSHVPAPSAKTQCSQINKYLKRNEKKKRNDIGSSSELGNRKCYLPVTGGCRAQRESK